MRRKLLSILTAMFLVIGCSANLIIPAGFAAEIDEPAAANGGNTENSCIYVSSAGDDETGDGTEETPFATLAKAVEAAEDGSTVYVLNDLTINDSVRVVNKSITIDGLGNCVTRGSIKQVQDTARSTYNPAMFEINNWNGNTDHHVLAFKNIILDDAGKTAGTIYSQQATDGTSDNGDCVQDAVIASYTANDIVLKEGAVIQNYGGMSAVRLTSDAKLIMENGAVIRDTGEIKRGHSENGQGQIGAVWLQGGQLDMQPGSEIREMTGRAVMVDGGTANVGGTISNIHGSSTMWYGAQGIGIHVRGEGKAVLSGHITKVKADTAGGDHVVVISNNGAVFESTAESVIDYIENMPVLFAYYSKDSVGGTVENCTFDYLFRGTYNEMTFSETALIQNNTCKRGVANAVVYSTNGAQYTFNGRMKNNDAVYAFYIINHGGGSAKLTMNEGAKLTGNGGNTGVYINASGCSFTMNGGEITNFSTGVRCRGKANSSAKFSMNGGRIYENTLYGINFSCYSGSKSNVELNGGTVENNGTTEIYMSSGQASDANEHLAIKSGVLGGKRNVKLSPGTISLDQDYKDVEIGHAKTEAVKKIQELVQAEEEYEGWSTVGSSAYWMKPSASEIHFKVTRPSSAKKTGLFVTYIPLQEDGTPAADAELTAMDEVKNTDTFDVTMEKLEPGTAYAVMFVNNDIYTLNPDDVAQYTGGGQGQETSKSGFPYFTLTDSVDEIQSLEIDGENTGLEGQDALEKLYEYIEVTVYDENGTEISNDLVSGDYIGKLSLKNESKEIRINGNEVVMGDEGGQLIVRDISDKKGAVSGETTHPLLAEEPTEPVEHAAAIAKKSSWGFNPKFYINNDKDRKIEDTRGISLLDDGLLTLDENDNRQELLENKAKEYLGIIDQPGLVTNFDFRYLDLVDAFNGNVWVSADNGVTVYIPYPEGTDQSTEFRFVHFMGLHREYSLKNQDDVIQAVNNCKLETMDIEKTDAGIKFDVGSSGFSPFALIWTGDETEEPPVGPVDPPIDPPVDPPVEPVYTSVNVNKIWKLDDGGKASDAVTVQLLKNGSVYDTAELSDQNNWSKTWYGLDAGSEWAVAEADVPEGFAAELSHIGNSWTITNDDTAKEPEMPVDPENPDRPEPPEEPDTPDRPEEPNSPDVEDTGNKNSPKTGDENLLGLWAALLAVSAAGGLLIKARKK